MRYFIKQIKCIAYFLVFMILFQSCVVYQRKLFSVEEASFKEEMPIKITTKIGDEYKVQWIEERGGNIVSIIGAKRRFFYKNEIAQISILYPDAKHDQIVPFDKPIEYHGTIHLLVIENSRHKSYDCFKISEKDEIVTAYQMTEIDTLTIKIPAEQIQRIELKDKKKTSIRTVGLIFGLAAGGALIVGIIAFINAVSQGGWGGIS